ncbi:outer membrane beta-barrel family protein [Cellulophaga omnivescoria]|uniref:outer membrane beta-barrel family protein n=1 Tax=Cellulophaga omnivescoria TaxID=1888890 RepID=UPI0009853E5D|nr:outer membrane beta-barrel family protein [Cellulophaga omnivescoria]WBU88885.1 outer membrane beta-barrel family protein [Cellulophaga omnivescoria]WKB80857.1 outer membrane beta-barrel family protein [Cellulophaga lytica]
MKKIFFLFFALSTVINAQQNQINNSNNTVKLSGTIVDSETKTPLEFATLIIEDKNNSNYISGGISNKNGKFSIDGIPYGNYNIKIEHISYKTYYLKNITLTKSKNLGQIMLSLDVEELNEVEIIAEKTTVELRLDKKIYNVGKDLTLNGGSASDVLNNIPAVAVDAEGTISLRGNNNVKILINGKPSTLSGISPEALKQMPVSTIQKVEVITNPSSKYSSSGTAGILNIILRKSKKSGLNGSITATVKDPEYYKLGVSLGVKKKLFNIFSNITYTDRERPGYSLFYNDFFDNNNNTTGFENEYRSLDRNYKNLSVNAGIELLLNKNSSVTNSVAYSKGSGLNYTAIDLTNFNTTNNTTINRNRDTEEDSDEESIRYSLNYKRKFNSKGHILTADYQYSRSFELEDRAINEFILENNSTNLFDEAITDDTQISQLAQIDYTLPFGKNYNSKIEVGYRGVYDNYNIDYTEGSIINNLFIKNNNYSNNLVYSQDVNAGYLQFSQGFNKFNASLGIRVEHTNLSILLTNTNTTDNKLYTNWFPSMFLSYEFSNKEKISLNYSKRIDRPTAGNLNPFPNRVSKTNLFYGNPDLDPMFTNSFEFNYINKWNKITFNSALFYSKTEDVIHNVVIETGNTETVTSTNGTISAPIIAKTKRNIAEEDRYGIDATVTYVPLKKWRLSLNMFMYNQKLNGNYNYTNNNNQIVNVDFSANQFRWTGSASAKLPLIYDVNFQTNYYYIGANTNSQTKTKALDRLDIAFSKNLLKNKVAVSIGVTDIFNAYKRYSTTTLNNSISYNELQSDQRNLRATLTYKFN